MYGLRGRTGLVLCDSGPANVRVQLDEPYQRRVFDPTTGVDTLGRVDVVWADRADLEVVDDGK